MSKPKARILLVEDYPVLQEMYADALRKHGFIVDVASDGEQALKDSQKTAYDLILLDILLPQMSGLEFLRQLRAQKSSAKIVILTDFDDPDTVEQVEDLGVDRYWMKVDNTPRMLIKRIEHLLSGS